MKKKRGQGIVKVSDLFLKYKSILKAPQGTVITACIESVSEIFGHTLSKSQCRYNIHTKTLTITVSGILKSEIILRKREILQKMIEKLGTESAPKDIR